MQMTYSETVSLGPFAVFFCRAEDASIIRVDVTNIKFNHTTNSSASDALNIREDFNTPYDISNGEWIKDSTTNWPMAYTTNNEVTIQVRLTVAPTNITSADVWAISTDTGGSLGDVAKTNVTFSGGVSSPEYVTFKVSGTTPACIQKTTNDVWQWKMENVNGSGSGACDLNTSGVHTVYTILREPQSPWSSTFGNASNAWTEVLDYACDWGSGATDEGSAVVSVTTNAYNKFPKEYDGSKYHTWAGHCKLTELLADDWADCKDMSAVVQLFTQILGGTTVQVRRVLDIDTKPILGIDNIGAAGTWTNYNWSHHQFGWYGGEVYDACLKLNQAAPYIPVGDDLNGSYKNNLRDAGAWNVQAPHTITSFE